MNICVELKWTVAGEKERNVMKCNTLAYKGETDD